MLTFYLEKELKRLKMLPYTVTAKHSIMKDLLKYSQRIPLMTICPKYKNPRRLISLLRQRTFARYQDNLANY